MRNKFHGLIRPQNHAVTLDVPSMQDILFAALDKQLISQPLVHPNLNMHWAEAGELARKVISRSKMRSTYKYPSTKMGCMIYCESNIEFNAAKILDSSEHVLRFNEQPVEINYLDINQIWRKHYPDFYVILTNGSQLLIEIKSDQDAMDDDVIQRTQILHRELKLFGITYLMISESQVNTGINQLTI